MKYKDYYQIMDVERDASQDEIKRAYRKLARKYHPDVSKAEDAEERFKEVGEAYEVLKDPEKRAAYDQLGNNWQAGQDFNPPPGWDAGFEFRGGDYSQADASRFSDFFEDLFGRGGMHGFTTAGGQREIHIKGQDHHAKIMINLDDAYHGAERTITLKIPEVDANGHLTTRDRSLSVKIPRGIVRGQRIRLRGQGAPGVGQGPAGDLYLEIEIEPHPFYRADGHDIYLTLPVTPWEAALGANVSIPTLGGKVDMKIPEGSQSGTKLRLKGRGLPGKQSGDQYVTLQIEVPPAKTSAARKLYEQMQEELNFNPRHRLGV